jgi:hypothetical protein
LIATIPDLNLEIPMVSIGDGLYKAYFSFPAGADVIGKQVVVISSDGGTVCRDLEDCSIVCDSCGDDDEAGCTRTQGYWKNHAEDWPLDSIVLGETTYTRDEAIEILKTPVKTDVTYSMAYQLIAAKLNVAAGADDSCIAEIIASADAWLISYGPVGSGVSAGSEAWRHGEVLHDVLDDYNNGRLCAPHCDTVEKSGHVIPPPKTVGTNHRMTK